MKFRSHRLRSALVLVGVLGGTTAASLRGDEPAALATMAIGDRMNLEENLRWILARERAARAKELATKKSIVARVGVFADAGCWHVGARAVVDALEGSGVACRPLDRTRLTTEGLAGLEAVVLPGGWAPFQVAAAGEAGLAALDQFARRGGRVLGICAGGYALSRLVIWEGQEFPYPIALFDGVAQGPVPGFLPWPERSPARLTVTKAGAARRLDVLGTKEILYYGGSEFVGGSQTTVLATYANGGAALIARPVGKGEVILCGAHPERPAPAAGADDAAPPTWSGPFFEALLLGPR